MPLSAPRKFAGFTLIEAVIYIALFAVIIGGVVGVAYQIIQSSAVAQEQALVYEEANFLLAKINWALLSGDKKICQPAVGNSSSDLDLRPDCALPDDQTVFASSGTDLSIKVGGGPVETLNSGSVKVENVEFKQNSSAGGQRVLQTVFRVTDKLTGKVQDISTIKYLRP